MTKPHPAHLAAKGLLVLLAGLPLVSRAGEPLIVVEDRGGTSALPYYESLNLQPRANAPARSPIPTPQIPATPADEAAMLPVLARADALLDPGHLYKTGGAASVGKVAVDGRTLVIKRYNIKGVAHWLKRL